jgi:hypothetical protein
MTTPACSVFVKQFEWIWYRENQLFSYLVRKVWWQWTTSCIHAFQRPNLYSFSGKWKSICSSKRIHSLPLHQSREEASLRNVINAFIFRQWKASTETTTILEYSLLLQDTSICPQSWHYVVYRIHFLINFEGLNGSSQKRSVLGQCFPHIHCVYVIPNRGGRCHEADKSSVQSAETESWSPTLKGAPTKKITSHR